MPELPEVEVLVRHLAPLLLGKTIRKVAVYRAKTIRPTGIQQLRSRLVGARFSGLQRRGKYLLFSLRTSGESRNQVLVGHLGMTGRMFLQDTGKPLPKHTAVALRLGPLTLVFQDTRYFGRLTLATNSLEGLGPEPLDDEFDEAGFASNLARSQQAIKVRLLDQKLVAGVGNIYASEALFRARIGPSRKSRTLSRSEIRRLRRAIRAVLREAIASGSTVPLNLDAPAGDGLFYFGQAEGVRGHYEERLRVYDRAKRPCVRCRTPIRKIVQAARSTYFCPRCQR